jgi:hypothetical protein
VVADALSRRSHVRELVVDSMPFELFEEFDKLNLRIVANTEATKNGSWFKSTSRDLERSSRR